MRLPYPAIAARLFNVPLMFHPAKAQAILSAVGGQVTGRNVLISNETAFDPHLAIATSQPHAGRLSGRVGGQYDRAGRPPFDIIDGVAVIPIEGSLVHKGAYVGSYSGETSYEGLQAQITRAHRRSDVLGVVFEVDSFGGEVAGAFETAAMIASLSRDKPTIAILTDFAMSAGYLLASAARQIIMPSTGQAGSIGIITMHVDYSRALENEGITVTLLSAGARKTDGNPFEPLPEGVANDIRARVESARQQFAAAVGRHRGSRLTAAAALETEARDYFGDSAVKAGLVDAIGDPNAAFAAFVARVNGR